MREPDAIKQYLEPDQYKLYKLIWNRFVASQMNPAIIDQTSVDVKAGDYTFRATGSVVKFPGFMAVYMEEKAEDQAPSEEENGEAVLPPLTEGEALTLVKLDPKQHFTQPPPRFSEALLVKTLEEKGIGRPSTYAAIISTIQERDYVQKVENKFRPTELGVLVSDLLVNHFPVIMDVAFTAKMEEELDKIEEGQMGWVAAVRDFYKPFSRKPGEGPGGDEGLQGRADAHRHQLREVRKAHDHQVGQERPVPRVQRLPRVQEHQALRTQGERRGRGRPGRDHGRSLPQVRLGNDSQTRAVRQVPRLLPLSRVQIHTGHVHRRALPRRRRQARGAALALRQGILLLRQLS
jgi:DNA topoisomerase-1